MKMRKGKSDMVVLETLLEITIYSAIIFTAIMLIKICCKKKISPFLQYALWGIFLLRLMLPVTIESSVHFFTLPDETTVSTQETAQNTQKDTFDSMVQSSGAYEKEQNNLNLRNLDASVESVKHGSEEMTTTSVTLRHSLSKILLIVWLGGVVICLCYFAVLVALLKKNVVKRRSTPSAHILMLVGQVKNELGIRAKLKVLCQDGYGTPALLFPRTLLLPMHTLAPMDDEQIRNCLRHECMHYKRGDQFINLLLLLMKAIYWFNPFVWLAFFQIRTDMESACDSAVVRHMSSSARRDYATLILCLFSQEKHRQIALGMVQDNTKKIAERRIKGVFMNYKTNKKVILTAFLVTSLLLFTCFTTACQPTPESGVVVGKNNEIIQNTIKYKKSDFPHTYQDRHSDNGVDIVFDASVHLPESDQLSCYSISATQFTQDQVGTIIKGLFGDQRLYDLAKVTKSEIEPEYIQALADLKNKQENPSQYEASEEYYQDRVDRLKERINSVLETDLLEHSDLKLKQSTSEKGVQYFSARGDLGKNMMATLIITNVDKNASVGHDSYLEFTNGNKYIDIADYYPDIQDNGPQNLKISKDEATVIANGVISQLGADYMNYSACSTGILYRSDQEYPTTFDSQMPQAYLIHYTRNINGVQVTYDQRRYSFSNTDESYSSSRYYEKIIVAIDDSGVTYIRWQGPVGINSVLVDNSQIISFDHMMVLAKKQLCYQYASFEKQEQDGEGATITQAQPVSPKDYGEITSNEVNIQKITLGLMQVPNQNRRDEYILVWDFFGYVQTDYENGEEIRYGKNKSLLTINAIDGSVINRSLGY